MHHIYHGNAWLDTPQRHSLYRTTPLIRTTNHSEYHSNLSLSLPLSVCYHSATFTAMSDWFVLPVVHYYRYWRRRTISTHITPLQMMMTIVLAIIVKPPPPLAHLLPPPPHPLPLPLPLPRLVTVLLPYLLALFLIIII